MIRTVVCQKEGCDGNKFHLEGDGENLKVTCINCRESYDLDVSYYDFIMLSNCSKCNNDIFKVFKDVEKIGVYAKCTECGAAPEKIYIDSNGIQVSYEIKLLNDLRDIVYLVEQRLCNLENKIEHLERGQEILEESLAYINRYIVEKD